eukprot:m.181309 g.181309  ORF g.181309 m.181309 type:complete len:334 (-) comp16870_c0_seq4:2181-3182(-)
MMFSTLSILLICSQFPPWDMHMLSRGRKYTVLWMWCLKRRYSTSKHAEKHSWCASHKDSGSYLNRSCCFQVLANTPLFRPAKGIKLEVCIDSVASAKAADHGGAHCVELCSALSEGGLTPTLGLVNAVTAACSLPVHVMLRPRAGDFNYTQDELTVLLLDCQQLKQCSIAGFVFGCLQPDGTLDKATAQQVLSACAPFPVTFHRAIDVSADPVACAVQAVELGFRRILTSGGCATALAGSSTIAAIQRAVGNQAIVMAASGVDESNALGIAQATGVQHLHASLRVGKESAMTHRVADVPMGSPLDSEYKLKTSSSERVANVVSELRCVQFEKE